MVMWSPPIDKILMIILYFNKNNSLFISQSRTLIITAVMTNNTSNFPQQSTRTSFQIAISSSLSCLIVNFFTNPLEVAKLRAQYSPVTCNQYPHSSFSQIMKCSCTAKLSFRDFFKGISVSLPVSVTTNMLYMTFYENFRKKIKDNFIKNNQLATIASSLCARSLVSMIMLPLQAFRIRFTNSTQQKVIRSRKLGLRVTVLKDLLYASSMWLTVESVRSILLRQEYRQSKIKYSQKYASISVIPAFLGTIVASFLTNPFDTLKTRLQSGINYDSHRTISHQLNHIHKQEGWLGLFYGIQHRLTRNVISAVVYISLYQLLLSEMSSQKPINT